MTGCRNCSAAQLKITLEASSSLLTEKRTMLARGFRFFFANSQGGDFIVSTSGFCQFFETFIEVFVTCWQNAAD